MAEHNLPWAYQPREFDDWGWIRDAAGDLAVIARGDKGDKSHDQHRRDKTDPYGDYAAFVLKAVNNHEALVKALDQLDTLLDFGDENLDSVWTFDDLTAIQAAFNGAKAILDAVGNVGEP